MESIEKIFQVKNPRSDLPHISNDIEVGVDKYYGRFIFSKNQLMPGDVLLLEEPFFKSLDIKRENLSKRCLNCLCFCVEIFTCESCCGAVAFCSQLCKDRAEIFHKHECHLLTKLDEEDGYFLLMMRMLIKSLNLCGSLDDFEQFMELRNKNATIFDGDNGDLDKLMCCFNLESGNFPQDIKFAKSFVDSETMRKFVVADERQKFFLVKIILKVLGILNRNSFCLELKDGNTCGAIFAIASLFNNSCSPNVDRIGVGNQAAFICNRPVKKFEQLFICYRRQFYFETKADLRQRELLEQFDFVCQCEACINPELFSINYEEKEEEEDDSRVHGQQENLDAYRINCQFIVDNIDEYPTYKLISALHTNRKILQEISDVHFDCGGGR